MIVRLLIRSAVVLVALASAGVAPAPASAALEPSPPTSLTATAGDGLVQLRWAPPEQSLAQVDGYEVLRDGVPVGTTAELAFTDAGLTNGTTYRYAVRAHSAFGWSDPSSEVTATPQPALTGTMKEQDPSSAPPTDLTARLLADARRAELTWAAPAGAAEVLRYRVYRSVNSDVALELVAEVLGGVTRFHDRLPSNPCGVVYYYVSAVYTTGESPLSNSAYVEPPSAWC